jgi:CubicO group peptidase (beta-lactamase class C family)
MSFWALADSHVESRRVPGYVGALRVGGKVEIRCGGVMTLGGPAMREDALFRIASVTKPIGGALTMLLVEEGVVALEDPIARWLPEMAEPRVIFEFDGPVEKTTPAARPVTVRDLLAFTSGWGVILARTPLQRALVASGCHPGPLPPTFSGDEFVARVSRLPLAFQPGTGWLYDTGIEVLGVLLARACGKPLSALMAERIFEPLGMADTAFWAVDRDRLTTAYTPTADGLEVKDPADGVFSRPPEFEMLGAGLVSTAADVLRFFTGVDELLRPESLALMTSDALNSGQRAMAAPIVGSGTWGLGTAVYDRGWGWDGGSGTSARRLGDDAGVLLTQREMTGAQDGFEDFWALV